jgi:hypothetical protein
MGSRFGRNQKRRMREQIAVAEQATAVMVEIDHRNKQTMQSMASRIREQDAIIELTERVVGDYFVTLPVKSRKVDHVPEVGEPMRLPAPRIPMPRFVPGEKIPLTAALNHIEVQTMIGSSEFDLLRQQVHVRFEADFGSVGYAVSSRTFRNVPRDSIVEIISREMAEHLVNQKQFLQRTALDERQPNPQPQRRAGY